MRPIDPAFALAALATLAFGAVSGCNDSAAEGAVVRPAPTPVTTQQRVRTVVIRQAPLGAVETVSGLARAFHKATVKAETQARVVVRRVERGQTVVHPLLQHACTILVFRKVIIEESPPQTRKVTSFSMGVSFRVEGSYRSVTFFFGARCKMSGILVQSGMF